MVRLHILFLAIAVIGCHHSIDRSGRTRYLEAERVNNAPAWESEFVQVSDSSTGLLLEFPLVSPLKAYKILRGSLHTFMMQGYRVELYPDPVEMVLRRNYIRKHFLGPRVEYLYEMRTKPLLLSGTQPGDTLSSAILPAMWDETSFRYYHIVPPGTYLLRVPEFPPFPPSIEVIREVLVREKKFSVVRIPLGAWYRIPH